MKNNIFTVIYYIVKFEIESTKTTFILGCFFALNKFTNTHLLLVDTKVVGQPKQYTSF